MSVVQAIQLLECNAPAKDWQLTLLTVIDALLSLTRPSATVFADVMLDSFK